MTKAQQNKIQVLKERFNAKDVSVHKNPLGLPDGWISVLLLNRNLQPFYQVGIEPNGSSHS